MTRPTGATAQHLARRILLVLTAGAVLLGGCTGDEQDEPAAEPTQVGRAGTIDQAPAPLTVQVAQIFGHARRGDARRFRRSVAQPVTRWLSNAYPADGDVKLEPALAPFTSAVRRQAARQRAVTTLGPLAAGLTQTVPTRRRLRLHGFADHGRVVGASATITWVLLCVADDGGESEVVLRGDVNLTRGSGNHWSILAFDLNRSTGAPGSYAASVKRQQEKQRDNKRDSKRDNKKDTRPGQRNNGGGDR